MEGGANVRIDKNNRRCLKFKGYIFLPGRTGKEPTWNDLRDAAMKTRGRIGIFAKDNKTIIGNGKLKPFNSLGQMSYLIEREKVSRISERVKTEAQKQRC